VRTPIVDASFNAGVGSFTSSFNYTTGAPKDTARPRIADAKANCFFISILLSKTKTTGVCNYLHNFNILKNVDLLHIYNLKLIVTKGKWGVNKPHTPRSIGKLRIF